MIILFGKTRAFGAAHIIILCLLLTPGKLLGRAIAIQFMTMMIIMDLLKEQTGHCILHLVNFSIMNLIAKRQLTIGIILVLGGTSFIIMQLMLVIMQPMHIWIMTQQS